jgi:hypothetical protein
VGKEGENDTTYSDCYLLNNSHEKNLEKGKTSLVSLENNIYAFVLPSKNPNGEK